MTCVGSDTIFRFENNIDTNICKIITNFVEKRKLSFNKSNNVSKLPWFEEDTIPFNNINDENISQIIVHCKKKITKLLNKNYNNIFPNLYPHFTDLVLWREGKKMNRHKDDGYGNQNHLNPRKVTTVTYLNDDYIGGETFITDGPNQDYISVPKIGTTVSFLSNEKNTHGVNEIIKGNRIVMSIWFTDDIKYAEKNFYKKGIL